MFYYVFMYTVYIIEQLEKHSSNTKPKTCTLTSDVIPAEAKAALITPTTSHFGHQILWPCKLWNAPAKQWLEKNGKRSCFQIISMSKTRISENWNKGQIGHVADNLYMATCSKIQHDSTIRIWARKAFRHQSLLSPWLPRETVWRFCANDFRLKVGRQTTHPGFDSRVQVKNSKLKLRNDTETRRDLKRASTKSSISKNAAPIHHQSSISNLKNLKIQSGHSLCLCCFPEPMACPQLRKGWLPGVDPAYMAQLTTLPAYSFIEPVFCWNPQDPWCWYIY